MRTSRSPLWPTLATCLFCFNLHAQDPATPPLPIPNAGVPAAPVATSFQLETLSEKFLDYAVESFGPRALANPAFSAAIRMANPPNRFPREWRDGGGAFGRNYGNVLASQTATSTGRFLAGALLHEDYRYRFSSNRNPVARTWHALAFTFIDRSDSGHHRLAVSNLIGAASGGFVGQLYLPHGFNDLSHAQSRMAIEFGGFAAQNVLLEFSPEFARIARKLHLPRGGIPQWWAKR